MENIDYDKELAALEDMPADELRQLQMGKLKKQIKYVYDNSPDFYQKKFDAIGAKPEDIKTWDDFRNLNLYFEKSDDRETQTASSEKYGHPFGTNLCAPIDKIIHLGSTTGTTGEPTFPYLFTKEDYEIHHHMAGRHFWKMGLRPGERVLYAAGAANLAGLRIYEHALRWYGCLPIPIGAEAGTEKILRMIDVTKPSTLLATGPLIEYLIEATPKILNKDVSQLGLKRLISSGAPAAAIPSVKKKIEDAYRCRLYDSFGGYIGGSCDLDDYQGMHLLTRDFILIMEDLVDPTTKEPIRNITDGMVGESRMTNLQWMARPFFKWSPGDIFQIFTETCKCGWKFPRIKILGRSDDMLIIKGVNVYPAAIKNVVSSLEPKTTGEMRIVLEQPGPGVPPPMKIKVECGIDIDTDDKKNALKKELEDAMHIKLKCRTSVTIIPPNTLERAAGPGAKGQMIEKAYEQKK
ncbi:MAG: phenylacetate--CoA ligase family protein [Proteobacteria bacterium]|nr:phenylacetate--CoA ligase family protein [Pseudomonadota bacterium]MBU4010953.1 phenylacetate--CoA ligase family protein [Pseudomonadota bacterium]MBU4035600.1 phenylacetate--CoA ligase family protein [Pseudomonadota bacterium]